MATTLNITTNYQGKVAGGIIGKMIKASNTISDNLVTILPNIVEKTTLRKIVTTQGWADYACGFTPTGSIVLSERSFTPKKLMLGYELCKEDFRQTWEAAEMGFSAHNDDIPKTEKEAIILEIAKNVSRKIDTDIWEGAGTTGTLSGLVPTILADAATIKVATPVAITSVTVEAQLQKFIDAIPDALLSSPDQILLVSTNVLRALRKVYGVAVRANGTFLSPNQFDFDGYTLTEGKGLNANTMIAYNRPNVFFGTGLLSDFNDIRVKDMDEYDLSGQMRIKVVFTGAIQYANSEEIVIYRF